MTAFAKIVDLISEKSPLQKKRLEKYFSCQSDAFFKEAEHFATQYLRYLNAEQIPIEYAVGAYIKMCDDMLRSQIYFMKTEKYPAEQANDVFEKADKALYQSKNTGRNRCTVFEEGL